MICEEGKKVRYHKTFNNTQIRNKKTKKVLITLTKLNISLFSFECNHCKYLNFRNFLSTETVCDLCEEHYCSICCEKECGEKHLIILFLLLFVIFFHYNYLSFYYLDSLVVLFSDFKFYLYAVCVHFGGLLLHKHKLKQNIVPIREYIKEFMDFKSENKFKNSVVVFISVFSFLISFICFFNFMLGIVSVFLVLLLYIELFD